MRCKCSQRAARGRAVCSRVLSSRNKGPGAERAGTTLTLKSGPTSPRAHAGFFSWLQPACTSVQHCSHARNRSGGRSSTFRSGTLSCPLPCCAATVLGQCLASSLRKLSSFKQVQAGSSRFQPNRIQRNLQILRISLISVALEALTDLSVCDLGLLLSLLRAGGGGSRAPCTAAVRQTLHVSVLKLHASV